MINLILAVKMLLSSFLYSLLTANHQIYRDDKILSHYIFMNISFSFK